ncbi:MAG: alkaline phosphatase family protein [Paracoccaceae bacterium]|nr:alkaline phosphatase family protein [Paracoccaceae bacterium]
MTGRTARAPLAMIAFDAAEVSLVAEGIAGGWLPNLARLLGNGAIHRIRSDSDLMVGTVWPSFYSGRLPPEHGIFGVVQWRAGEMRHDRPDGRDWIDTTPFYRTFGDGGPRVLAIDMPFAPSAAPFEGTELVSWNAHATRGRRGTYPADRLTALRRRHGRPEMRDEIYGPQTPRGLLKLRDGLVRSARQQGVLAADLLRRERWDFALIGLGAVHRAGHKLVAPQVFRGGPIDPATPGLDTALPDVYAACDDAIGRILAALPAACRTLVFSLNGMGPNTSHYFLLPEMLRRILDGDRSDGRAAAAIPLRPPLERLRDTVPLEWRSALKEHLPTPAKDRLGRFWRKAEARDWSRVRAFRLIGSDYEGQIRINLQGRERGGVVQPGDEYEDLIEDLIEGLPTFVDADTGAPVIRAVIRTDTLWPEAAVRGDLPDLVVQWADRSPLGLTALRSERYGAFANPWSTAVPDGRSGHHRPAGWAIASGPGRAVPASGETTGAVQDLTATVYALLGLPTPAGLAGRPISGLLDSLGDR